MTARVRFRAIAIWAAVAAAVLVPIAAAAASPQLEWRGPVYIVAGFAGVVAMTLLLLQPLAVAGVLPGLASSRGRRAHRWIGALLVGAIVVHVAGLWVTSPPDVIDALLFRSPTSFSAWGVIAMWALFAAAILAVFRRKLALRTWRRAHTALAAVVVAGSVIHALLILGTMETVSKVALCLLASIATVYAIIARRSWRFRKEP